MHHNWLLSSLTAITQAIYPGSYSRRKREINLTRSRSDIFRFPAWFRNHSLEIKLKKSLMGLYKWIISSYDSTANQSQTRLVYVPELKLITSERLKNKNLTSSRILEHGLTQEDLECIIDVDNHNMTKLHF